MASQSAPTPSPEIGSTLPDVTLRYEDLKALHRQVLQSLLPSDRLSPAQVRVLRLVAQQAQCSQAQLIEETGFGKQKLSGIVGALITRQLLRQRTDPRDRRKHTLTARQQAERLLALIDRITTERVREAAKTVSDPCIPPPVNHGHYPTQCEAPEREHTNPEPYVDGRKASKTDCSGGQGRLGPRSFDPVPRSESRPQDTEEALGKSCGCVVQRLIQSKGSYLALCERRLNHILGITLRARSEANDRYLCL